MEIMQKSMKQKAAIYNLQCALDKGAEVYNAREYIEFREASLDN